MLDLVQAVPEAFDNTLSSLLSIGLQFEHEISTAHKNYKAEK